jgi:hypothetical protein
MGVTITSSAIDHHQTITPDRIEPPNPDAQIIFHLKVRWCEFGRPVTSPSNLSGGF